MIFLTMLKNFSLFCLWGIDESVFQILDQLWGRHTVDRFATDYNTKCKRFNSKYWCQNTEAVDSNIPYLILEQ
jgi:hypothetical protein